MSQTIHQNIQPGQSFSFYQDDLKHKLETVYDTDQYYCFSEDRSVSSNDIFIEDSAEYDYEMYTDEEGQEYFD